MNKLFLLLPLMILFVGCTDSEFIENEEITKYAEDKYFETLKKDEVKFLKCLPNKNGTMTATYTTDARDNSFPSTIRFDYINQTYNVYFDKAYKNGLKQRVLDDVDSCMNSYNALKEAKSTWK